LPVADRHPLGILTGVLPVALLLLSLVLTMPEIMAQESLPEDKEIELESIRTRIRDVQTKITEARRDANSYQQELKQNEVAAAEIAGQLDALESEIAGLLVTLQNLQRESDDQQRFLDSERILLAEQIRVAYKTGRHDFLKLLLNQEDPDMIGRMITYHDYYSKARTDRIADIKITLQNLISLRARIDQQTEQLGTLRNQQLDRLQELTVYRDSRSSIVQQLEKYISEQGQQLQSLQINEAELAELLDNLDKSQSVVELYEDLPPFDTLRGKLRWPLQGQLISRFGATKRDGKLTWNGVRLAAEAGQDVSAISPGKVVFADWFSNLGLLIIIDHGGGYLSLYGHNERLLKKTGDFVLAGEPISKAGDTGGQTETALYFEIRRQGTPVDPGLWCRG